EPLLFVGDVRELRKELLLLRTDRLPRRPVAREGRQRHRELAVRADRGLVDINEDLPRVVEHLEREELVLRARIDPAAFDLELTQQVFALELQIEFLARRALDLHERLTVEPE